MDFSTNNDSAPRRNYFSRREQLRMLLLVMSLGLVIILIKEASDPANWGWLTDRQEPAKSTESAYQDDYDTEYVPSMPPDDPLGAVQILPNTPISDQQWAQYFPGVNPVYLKNVRDNEPFRGDEAKAWFNLLEVLDDTESHLLRDASTGNVSFTQLLEQPEAYRGELVTVRGSVKRSQWYKAGKNSAGIDGYYRIILRPLDGPSRPMFIYTLNLPADFPVGDNLQEEIDVTGFFYKNWVYLATNRTWLAPVLLSRDITWTPSVTGTESNMSLTVVSALALLAAGIAIVFAWQVYVASKNMFWFGRQFVREKDVPATFDTVGDADVLGPIEKRFEQSVDTG